MGEMWRDVVGYEGNYQISSHGQVRRTGAAMGATVGRILCPVPSNGGYRTVQLCLSGERRRYFVHRLVLDAFVSPEPDMQCNHKNGIKDDNRLENLEWTTASENTQHCYDVLGRSRAGRANPGELNGRSILTVEKVRAIRALYASGQYSHQELGDLFAVSDVTIGLIIRRERWGSVL